MATAPTSITPAPLARLRSSARTLFIGLLWGGTLLVILAWWLGLKFADERSLVLPWVIGILGGAGLALAGWHAFVLWIQKLPPDQHAPALANLRRITAMALLLG